jgi:hypothetical protein
MNKNILCHCGRIAFLYTSVISPIDFQPVINVYGNKHYHHFNNYNIYKCVQNHENKLKIEPLACYCDLKIFNPKK